MQPPDKTEQNQRKTQHKLKPWQQHSSSAKDLEVMRFNSLGILDAMVHDGSHQATGLLLKVDPVIHEEAHPDQVNFCGYPVLWCLQKIPQRKPHVLCLMYFFPGETL